MTAFGLSPMPSASTSRSWCSVMPGGATAASARSVSNRDAAAATFDVAGMCPWFGRFASSHRWVCPYATGCALTTFTSASVVPLRATSTKFTGTRYSPMIRRFGMTASASCATLTPPSIEFSIAIIAATLRPSTTSSSASPTLLTERQVLPGGLRHLLEGGLGERAGGSQVRVGLVGGRSWRRLRHGSSVTAGLSATMRERRRSAFAAAARRPRFISTEYCAPISPGAPITTTRSGSFKTTV